MVITKPFKVLVCLALVGMFVSVGAAWGYNAVRVTASPGVQADALSADTALDPVASQKKGSYKHAAPARHDRTQASRYARSAPRTHTLPYSNPIATYPPVQYAPCPPAFGYGRPAANPFGPLVGVFNIPGFPFSRLSCNAYLPRPNAKQFHFAARLWYAKLDGSTEVFGTVPGIGVPGTELDLNRDLGLGTYNYIPEYEGLYQLRCNWGIRFNFMPIVYDEINTVHTPLGFWWGGAFYPFGAQINTKWNRNIYNWELVYSWFNQKHAVSTIFAGYRLYDDRLSISSTPFFLTRTMSRTFGLASAGASLEKIISSLGGGGVASIHCKFSLQFLEGYFGWDGQGTGRISVPFNCGRWGYLEAGWRWMSLERGDPAFTDKTALNGLIGSVGVIF